MKRFFSLALIFFAVQCLAQSSGTAQPGTQRGATRRKLPGGERSMKGCLVRNNDGGYELQSVRGRRVKLSGSEDLATQIGHEVRLSGAFIDAPDAADVAGDGAAASGSSRDKTHHAVAREFQVIKVESLANVCKPTSGTRAR
jgi:hypothetical protein